MPQSTWAVEVELRAGQPPISLWVFKSGSSSLPPSVVGCLGPEVVTSAQLQAWFSFQASNASFPPVPGALSLLLVVLLFFKPGYAMGQLTGSLETGHPPSGYISWHLKYSGSLSLP